MANYSDMMQMCRLCLVKDQVNLPIFGGQGDIQQIFLKITACLPVKVSREDNLPKSICDGCSYKLDLLYQFWNTSSNSEKQLIDWLTAAGVDPKHTSNEPIGLASQPSVILKQEPVGELDAISSETQSYIMQQQQLAYKPEEYDETQAHAKSIKKKASTDPADESSPKRPRRATRNTKSVKEIDDDSEDDYLDNTDAGIAKTEDETEEEDEDDDGDMDGEDGDDMADPDFVAAEGDAEQPGPSGVGGTKTTSGPSSVLEQYEHYKAQYGLKDCVVFVGEPNEFDHKLYRFMKTQAYCDVDKTNILPAPRLKYRCDVCTAKFRDHYRLKIHMDEAHADQGETTSASSASSEEVYEPESEEEVGGLVPGVEKAEIIPENVEDQLGIPSTKEDFMCVKCFRKFKSKFTLTKHLKNAHNMFGCFMCSHMYYSEENLRTHTANVHRNKQGKWRCNPCAVSFTDYYHLAEHNFAKHKPTCLKCKKDFPDLQTLIKHKVVHHGIPQNIICKECGLTTLNEPNLEVHMRWHQKQKAGFHCELCYETLPTDKLYLEHMKKDHVGKQPSPRVLNHSQKLPSIKMKFTKNYSPPNTIGNQANCSYKVSLPGTSDALVSPTVTTMAVTSCGSPGQSSVKPLKIPIPKLGANQAMLLKKVLPAPVAQSAQTFPQLAGKEAPKLLLFDKSNNRAYVLPGIMVQQNGQIKLSGTPGESVAPGTPSQPLANFIQPTISGLPQPTIANFVQPAINKIVQPTISNVVQQTISAVQPSMAPTFVMSSISNTTQTTNVQNNIIKISNTMSNFMSSVATVTKSSSAVAQPKKCEQPKKIAIPRLMSLGPKQYKGKQIQIKLPMRSDPPEMMTKRHIPINQSQIVVSNVRSQALKSSSDVSEMPRLEIQAADAVLPVEVKELAVERMAPPTLTPEIADGSATRPKIFLKPISQLLEKPKVCDADPCVVNTVNTRPVPSTSKQVTVEIASKQPNPNANKVITKTKSTGLTVQLGQDKTLCRCSTCGATFKRLWKLQEHRTKMKCKLCSYSGCRLKALNVHYKVIHDYKNQCVTCDEQFSSAEMLKDHNKQRHLCIKCNKLYALMERHRTANVCQKCNQYECTSKDLTDHYQTHHNINNFCNPCKMIFEDDKTLIDHKRQMHYCYKCKSFKMNLEVHQSSCKVIA